MQRPENFDPMPPMPPPTRPVTTTTHFQSDPTEMLVDNERRKAEAEAERLGYHTLPLQKLIDSLSLPGSIGTALAAGAAFTIISTDSVLGESSPEAKVEQKRMVTLLSWAGLLFCVATVTTVCLQGLYASPPVCRIISDKLHYKAELRTKFQPWPSWDFLRYIMAYTIHGMVYLALSMHLTASLLVIEAAKRYIPALEFQILIGVIAFMTIVIGSTATAMEALRERGNAIEKGDVPAARTVRQEETHIITSEGVEWASQSRLR